MAGPYDITTKYIIHQHPEACLQLIGHAAAGRVSVVDTNISAVSAEADTVLRVESPAPHLIHLELQASADARMGLRLARYNLMLQHQYELPVLSSLVLLRREADGPSMRGVWLYDDPTGHTQHRFTYQVIRLWTEPPERFLEGPVGLVPFAPLAAIDPADLPSVVRMARRRIDQDAASSDASVLDVVTYILMGLRYPANLADQLFPGVRRMRESSTYMAILNEGEARGRAEGEARGRAEGEARGRAAEAQSLLLLMGTTKLGPPSSDERAALEAINDIERLERMGPRLFTVTSWVELLETR